MARPTNKSFDLGIAIAHATTMPNQTRTFVEIAAYCDCDQSTIRKIANRAMRKLRRGLEQFR